MEKSKMPKLPSLLPQGVRATDKLTFGHFVQTFPKGAVKGALAAEGRNSIRERDLPNDLVVYFVMMLALFREASAQEVLRIIYESVQWLFGPHDFKVMAKSGISQARSRVGWEPFARVFKSVAQPLAEEGAKGSFFKGLRVVAVDGSVFDVADTAENAVFGRPRNQNGNGAYPQARLVSLVECGTHATFAATVGAYSDSEQKLVRELFPRLDCKMICLADRNFLGAEIFRNASETGAKLLWRATTTFKLLPEERLPDGSYLTKMYAHDDRKRESPVQVRVIEYVVSGANEVVRLVTNWLDHAKASAEELAILYHERWEYENMMDELKVHLNANVITLRSQKPDLVKQELYGIVMAHYAIRKVMHQAATKAGIDDDELSFVGSLRVIRRRLPMFGSFPPSTDSGSDYLGDTVPTREFQSRSV
jgi:hypothetical protein